MSTIPTMNPSLTMTNMNTRSKTTLNSNPPGGGYGAIAIKSNRNKGVTSPFKADKQLLASEINRVSKDDTRNHFSSVMDNLPAIGKKTITIRPAA